MFFLIFFTVFSQHGASSEEYRSALENSRLIVSDDKDKGK